MNELKIFENKEFGAIRTVTIEGEPWLVGKDVTQILGYSNPSKALNDHVDNEDKLNNESLSSLGQRGGWLINESGLYSLVLSSKLPNAKKFKHWVTSEVLPSIRKTGGYIVGQESLSDDELLQRAILVAQRKIAERDKLIAEQQQQIAEMQPKACYYDLILSNKSLVSTSVIAKDYGWSAAKLNKYLHEKGVQYKQGDTWLLYQKHSQKGYTGTKTHHYLDNDGEQHVNEHTYWTQKGRLFIYNLLKANNILPQVEKQNTESKAM